MDHSSKNLISRAIPALIVFVLLGGVLIYVLVQLGAVTKHVMFLSEELVATKTALSLNTTQLSKNVTELNKKTTGLTDALTNTEWNINAVKTKVGGVEQTVGSITGTVNTLKKLSEVDPQILKKYSKVYFMNENYVPAHLATVPEEYTYSSGRQEQFLTEASAHLIDLFAAAKKDGVTLYVKSGYRSFTEQKSLKSFYSVVYGAGTANAFSADQGYSEHQLGTTLDFITTGLGGNLTTSFDTTEAYKWLVLNAHRYGFILSYPKGNKYYVYEPWHWRYVGVKLATYLHDNGLRFYDLDQREIDKYLISAFD